MLVVASLDNFSRLLPQARLAVQAGAAALEVRADRFPRTVLKPEPLRDVLETLRLKIRRPLILTLRRRAEGGGLPRSIDELDRLSLFRAALTEVHLLDVELAADDINHHVVSEAHKRGRAVIVSHHNFRKTPPDAVLRNLARKARRLKADILKIAARPRTPQDVARLMAFCERAPLRYRICIPMGPLGRASRIDGFAQGSCLTYAHAGRAVAPGQWSVRDAVEALRNRA
jgi:3-dehydroquinate dehydratase I